MIAQGCEATLWSSAQVRRFLENEGYKDLWAFLEPDAPISGHDLLSLTSEDWHRLFKHHQEIPKPSVIKVRRLLNQLAKLKVNNSVNNVINKEDSEDLSEAEEDFQNLHLSCPYCHQQPKVLPVIIKPERWKALLAFLYVLVVSWITAFVMVIVHDRVPDMEKYPPLPDIILDNVPHIPWAFEMCEVTGMILWSVWFFVVLFHRHRFVLMRRFFSIFGTIFMLRCITMLITSLSVPGTHLECQPRPYGDVWNKLHNAYIIWTGAGMSLQGVRTCGDYMFSGHTVALTLLNFFITEYTTRRIYFLHTFTWICNVFGVFFILAAHEHYSIDVFVAFYISSRLFMYYHMLANQTKNKRFDNLTTKEISYDAQRAWFWFPLFSFFESGIDGKIPNEFAWPLTIKDIRDILVYIQDGFYNLVKTSKIKKKKKKTT